MKKKVKITGELKPDLSVKRFHPNGLNITSDCPKCGESSYVDTFYYPPFNEVFEHTFYCDECDYEWQHKFKINISLEAVDDT